MASRGRILVFMYFVLISCILIGSVMYVVEGPESGFTSIPVSIYWCIVTLTTVGFGDITPITPLGQFIASFVMIMGYGIIAVPTGIVTAEIAKNNIKKAEKNKRICNNCTSEEHTLSAKYCSECGFEL
jgi:voltage-gated potassium channel